MLALILEEMTRYDVIENGIAQKLQALIAIRDVVVVVGSVSKGLIVDQDRGQSVS